VAYTADELTVTITRLEGALVRGELEVQFADRSVRYKSSSEILTALDYFKRLLALAAGGRAKQSVGVTWKGL
jgi:hypothetical protein